jgi:hypothetical protein
MHWAGVAAGVVSVTGVYLSFRDFRDRGLDEAGWVFAEFRQTVWTAEVVGYAFISKRARLGPLHEHVTYGIERLIECRRYIGVVQPVHTFSSVLSEAHPQITPIS